MGWAYRSSDRSIMRLAANTSPSRIAVIASTSTMIAFSVDQEIATAFRWQC
jgi:hypothetical protein